MGDDDADAARPFRLISPSCASRKDFFLKLYFTGVISLSMVALLALLARLLSDRWRAKGTLWLTPPAEGGSGRGRRGGFSIADLFQHLMVLLCVYQLVYGITDYFFFLDCYAPVGWEGSEDAGMILYPRIYVLSFARQFFAGQVFFLHGSIAYCMYAYMVLKVPAATLYRKPRVLIMTGATLVGMFGLAGLTFGFEEKMAGYKVGRFILTDLVVIPTTLFFIARWYILVIKELRMPVKMGRVQDNARAAVGAPNGGTGGGHVNEGIEHQPPIHEEVEEGRAGMVTASPLPPPPPPSLPANKINSSALGSASTTNSARSLDTATTTTTTTTTTSLHPAVNQQLLSRLNYILYVITGVWLMVILTDFAMIVRDLLHLPFFPILLVIRATILCALGLIDALILGLDGDCCRDFWGSWSKKEMGVGDNMADLEAGRMSRLARPGLERLASFSHSLSSIKGMEKSGFLSLLPGPATTPEDEAMAIVAAAEAANRLKLQHSSTKKRDLRVFVCTYNMGGVLLDDDASVAALVQALPRWIPSPGVDGLDVYVLGVQECCCLTRFRDLVHTYLGGPKAYTLFTNEIGDAVVLHGYVGLTLFVRSEDVASGAFYLHRASVNRLATGVDVMGLRIPNKGVVGLSARYHDSTLAFVTAHFASDKKGRNKLWRRNRDAMTMLRRLCLVWDDGAAFDVHHQHMHTFFCGDANYRCLASPRDVLSRVAQSARLSQEACLGKNISWRQVQYRRLLCAAAGHLSDNYSHKEEEEEDEEEEEQMLYPPYLPAVVPLSTLAVSVFGSQHMVPSKPSGGVLRRLLVSLRPGKPSSARWSRGNSISNSARSSSNATDRRSMHRDSTSNTSYLSTYDEEEEEGEAMPAPLALPSPSTSSSLSSSWGWISSLDELLLCKQQRLIFWGWREGRIRFPPSYRWQRRKGPAEKGKEGDGLAGDFVSLERLFAAYTTRTTAMALVSASSAVSPVKEEEEEGEKDLDEEDGFLDKDKEQGEEEEEEEEEEEDVSVVRTPSYTDRVLTHSLPGHGFALRWEAYDMADGLELSDHRPVAATYSLQVDAGVRGWALEEEGEGQGETQLAVFTFVFSKPQIEIFSPPPLMEMMESGAAAEAGTTPITTTTTTTATPHTVTFLFPLVPEDPVAEERLATALNEALPSTSTSRRRNSSTESGTDGGGGQRGGPLTTSSQRDVRWARGFPVRFEVAASPRFSQHMLLKLVDAQGRDLGETVVPVVVGLGAAHNKNKKLRLPLTRGGAFQGWVCVDMSVGLRDL